VAVVDNNLKHQELGRVAVVDSRGKVIVDNMTQDQARHHIGRMVVVDNTHLDLELVLVAVEVDNHQEEHNIASHREPDLQESD
jgi:hypothetical protein